jgi:NADPH:quinone reductase-like Zn-dependent oxidoreductase/acyl carrier protein
VGGVAVDWAGFDRDYERRRVVLPTYPFQRQRYWIDVTTRHRPAAEAALLHPLLGSRVATPLREQLFTARVGPKSVPFLGDHAFLGRAVYPAAAYVEMALAAADAAGLGPVSFEGMAIEAPLVFENGEDRPVQSIVGPADGKESAFEVFGREGAGPEGEGGWTRHVTGRLVPQPETPPQHVSLAELQARCPEAVSVEELYERYRASGVEYGPAFRGMESLRRGESCAVGRVRVPDAALADAGAYRVHPALLDAAFQLLGAVLPDDEGGGSLYLPTGLKRLAVSADVPKRLWAFASLNPSDPARLLADLRLFDDSGRVAVEVNGLLLQRTSREAVERNTARSLRDWLYEVRWPVDERPASDALPSAGTWVVLLGASGVGAAVASRLEQGGSRCVRVLSGDAFGHGSDGSVTVRPDHPEDFEALLAFAASDGSKPVQGIVHLWGVDDEEVSSDADGPFTAIARSSAGALHLVQAACRAGGDPVRLWLVTRGAQATEGDGASVVVSASALWGLGRTIAAEHPELRCVCVDLDPAPGRDDGAADVLRELGQTGEESQVAYRQGNRRLARLERAGPPSAAEARAGAGQSLQLQISQRGVLDNLRRVPVARRAPGRGEVEIQVRAAGLNFRDVLNALGMYAGEAGLLGNELAGTVVAVGEGVSGLAPGDAVMGMGDGCFCDFVTAPAVQIVRTPERLSFEEAATIPVVFLTAQYALGHLAQLARGERVLVHSAAGGVGMAAVQIAQRAGAEIFATAGSPAKREMLASLGIRHVMDSRSTKFVDEIRERTGGAGIDVVLNSLTGEAIPSSLSLLREGGRFLEIGKAGIWEPERVAAEYPHVRYHVVFLGALTVEEPALVQEMLSGLGRSLAEGTLQPLPLQVFPLREAARAFRHMAAARHVGKIVLAVDGASEGRVVREDGTYLITGGLGGLVLRTARWLVDEGARSLVLVGRSAPSPAARDAVREIEALGARVAVRQADVSRREDVSRLLAETAGDAPPLRGVIHAAGVLDDGALLRTTWERIVPVLAAKAEGAWNLHRSTRDLPLDFFVMYSSVASVFGSPGQAGYAAANAFLDGLAHRRTFEGRPALSVNWGPWAEVGMAAAQDEAIRRRRAQGGADPISPADGLRALEELLGRRVAQAVVFPVRWATFLGGRDVPPFLRDVVRGSAPARPPAAGQGPALLREIAEAPESERAGVLLAHVRQQALKVLGLGAGHPLDPDQPLSSLGLDSLMAVELRNALGESLGVKVELGRILDATATLALLAAHVQALLPRHPELSGAPIPPGEGEADLDAGDAARLLQELPALSNDQVDELLSRVMRERPR